MKVRDVIVRVENSKPKSAWNRGIKEYMLDLLRDLDPEKELNRDNVRRELLNGAENWLEYSYGGCALIYDGDIAKRLCCPSELKRRKYGDLPPNSKETWLDTQGRALGRAAAEIKCIVRFS